LFFRGGRVKRNEERTLAISCCGCVRIYSAKCWQRRNELVAQTVLLQLQCSMHTKFRKCNGKQIWATTKQLADLSRKMLLLKKSVLCSKALNLWRNPFSDGFRSLFLAKRVRQVGIPTTVKWQEPKANQVLGRRREGGIFSMHFSQPAATPSTLTLTAAAE